MLPGLCPELLTGTAWGLLAELRRLGELGTMEVLEDLGAEQGAVTPEWVIV